MDTTDTNYNSLLIDKNATFNFLHVAKSLTSTFGGDERINNNNFYFILRKGKRKNNRQLLERTKS